MCNREVGAAKGARKRGAGKTEPWAHTARSGRGGSGVYASNMAERHERINRYFYFREVLAELESTLSPERMSTYESEAKLCVTVAASMS